MKMGSVIVEKEKKVLTMAEYFAGGHLRFVNGEWRDDNGDAIEISRVRHGRWIGAPLWGNDNCKCSECGSWHNIHANLRGKIMQKYCPNCGAKMDLEK